MDDKKLSDLSYEDMEKIIEEMASSRTSADDSSEQTDNKHKFKVLKTYLVLDESYKQNIVFSKICWGNFERYDLRRWDKSLSIPYKGITFSIEELSKFLNIKKPSYNTQEAIATYSAGRANAYIYETILELSQSNSRGVNWIKQICLVDWGNGKKFDIRKWTKNFDRCSKGICLNAKAFATFYNSVLAILREEK